MIWGGGGLLMLMTSGPLPTAHLPSTHSRKLSPCLLLKTSYSSVSPSVSFSRQSNCAQPQVSLDGVTLQCKDVAKCLGYIWNSTLSSKPMIDHNITKAMEIFFCLWQYRGIPRQHLSTFMSLRDRLCRSRYMDVRAGPSVTAH